MIFILHIIMDCRVIHVWKWKALQKGTSICASIFLVVHGLHLLNSKLHIAAIDALAIHLTFHETIFLLIPMDRKDEKIIEE